jgi:hypothetical protein
MIRFPPPRQGRAAWLYDEQAQRRHQEMMLARILQNAPKFRPIFFARSDQAIESQGDGGP